MLWIAKPGFATKNKKVRKSHRKTHRKNDKLKNHYDFKSVPNPRVLRAHRNSVLTFHVFLRANEALRESMCSNHSCFYVQINKIVAAEGTSAQAF